LGGSHPNIMTTAIDSHTVISVKKSENSPKKYPRKAGMPSKNPLS